ncbi:hypothetical protein [Nocardia xishanensis]
MIPNSRRTAAVLAAPLAVLLTTTACSSDSASSTVVTYPTVEFGTPGPGIGLGEQDQRISGQFPEPLHVGTITPIGIDQILGIEGESGSLEKTVNAIDPASGKITTRVVVGPGIWDPVVHGFVGKTPNEPAVIAAEVWRPRGSRGRADFTISTYSGNLLEPAEVKLPDVARVHSREGSHAVTSDGRYFVTWDDGLYGVRVVDLRSGGASGAARIVGCGPFTWVTGHEIYSVCEDSRELLHITIGADGVPKEAGRAKVLPMDFVSARTSAFAAKAKKALLVGANGDVFIFDFADGMPTAAARPVGNAGDSSGRFADNAINTTGTRLAISYTDSIIHPHSARAGSVAKVVVYDAATLVPLRTYALADLGVTKFISMAFSVDGSKFYVLGVGPEVDGTAPQRLVGFDAITGVQVSAADLTGNVKAITDLITPEVRE